MDRKPRLSVRGASDASTFKGTPEGFSPFRARRNFRARNPRSDRPGGGRRPCLRKLLATPLKNAPVQGLIPFSRAQAVVGNVLGTCEDMGEATSSPAGPLVGQIAALDEVPSMDWFVNLDVTGAGGPAANAVQCCAWDPDGDFLAVASNYNVGSDARFTVARIDPDNGDVMWAANSSDPGFDRSVNDILVTKLYTFVAIANNNPAAGAPKIIAYRNDTGAQAWTSEVDGWAKEGVCLALYTAANGQEYVYFAFHGSPAAGTYTGGIGGGLIQYGRWALHFRSGIAKYRVDGTAYGGSVAVEETYGTPLTSSDPYFEANHRYWRLSEQNRISGRDARPHGGEITALAAGSDGSLYFAKRNQGWGPNDDRPEFRPDGNFEPYATVGKIDPEGVLAWIGGDEGIKELDDLGFYNDLTYPGDTMPDPSISALCVDDEGDVYAAGRRNAAGLSVFAMHGDTGVVKWTANVMGATGTVREGAAAVDADGNPVFAGDRNTSWDGAGGQNAHLWKLNRANGEVVSHFDLRKGVSALGVACSGDGRTFYTTDKIS